MVICFCLKVKRNTYAEVISKRVQKHRKVVYEFRKNRKASDNSGDAGLNEALRTVWRELVQTLRTSAINFDGYEFDSLFEAIELHEPSLQITSN
jgi:hypothetical protein